MEFNQILQHIENIRAQPVTQQGIPPAGVDHLTLIVEHIIVLQLLLPDTEVVSAQPYPGPVPAIW